MYQQVISFWFEEIESAMWWKKDEAFDALLVERFSGITAEEIEFLTQPGSSF